MKLKYLLLMLLIVFILSIFYDPIWLKLRFGCNLMDFGNKYTVWMKCQEKKGVDFGVVDYKFSRGKLFVKRYIVYDYDESFYYCPEVEFYIYDGKNRLKYDKKSFSSIAENYGFGSDFLSIDDRYLDYYVNDKCNK